jgi:outer membrane protein insertion porin family
MTTPRRLIQFLGVLLFFPLSAAASASQGSTDIPPPICRITFSADGVVDTAALENHLLLKPGDLPDAKKLRQSIENLYARGDIYFIECTAEKTACGLWLEFRLVLKRYFAAFQLHSEQPIKNLSSDLARYFPLGEPFSENRLQRFKTETQKYLSDQGYSPVELATTYYPEPGSSGIRISLSIRSGKRARLGKIAFLGDAAFSEERMQRSSKLKAGRAYSKEKLLAAVEKLKELHVDHGYLAPKISVENAVFAKDGSSVNVTFRVQSGSPFEVSVDGAKISGSKLRELLPIYREADLDVDLLQEGKENLQAYLLRQGFSSADIEFAVRDKPDSAAKQIVYQLKLGQKLVVDRVDVQGLKTLDREDFISIIGKGTPGIRQNKYFTLLGFESAAQRVLDELKARGYLQARYIRRDLTIAERGTVDLDFEIAEGEQSKVRAIVFSGNQQLGREDLSARILLASEKPFSERQLEADRKNLQEYYLEKGYPNSRVQVSWHGDGTHIDIDYLVEEYMRLSISDIMVIGNEKTHLRAIMKNLGFKSNDSLVVKRLFEGEQKLYNTSGFDQVRIRATDQELRNPSQTVIVAVRETQPRVLSFGIGYQDYEGPRGLFELTYLNLGGSLRTGQVRLWGSKINQGIQLNLRAPRPLNKNLESFASIQASRKEEVSFTEQRYGLSVQTLRELSRVNTLAFRYSYEHVDIRDAQVALSEIPRVSQPVNLSSFSTSFINDSRDNPFDPKRGSFSTLNLQVTTPFFRSEAQFVKFFGQSQLYFKLPKRAILVEAFRLGVAKRMDGQDPLLPISERFFAGGSTTLRGFANDEAGPRDAVTDQPVGGNALLINNLELWFPIVSHFGGVLFYDTGNVFSRVADISLRDFTNSMGFGLKFQTPIGPVRFDYGFNLNPIPGKDNQHFFFSFGPIF